MPVDSTDSGGVSDAPEKEAAFEATDNEQAEVVGKPRGRPKGRKNSKAAIGRQRQAAVLDLHIKGVSNSQIAKATEISTRQVEKILAQFRPVFKRLEEVDKYRKVRRDLLDATELHVLESMVREDKIEKASFNNLAYGLTQVSQLRRLESGQSTQNIASQRVEVAIPKRQDD